MEQKANESESSKSEISKQDKQKELLLENLKKAPIVQLSCEKVGISRATFYRWKKDDAAFAEKAERAILNGQQLINELAESQLISAIKDKNMTAILFWLRNNHKNYKAKIELSGEIKTSRKLTPEQEEQIMRALELSHMTGKNDLDTADDPLNEKI
jgi:ACT domain-containing protein